MFDITMQHVVQAPGSSRAFLTRLAFVAHDFRQWGYFVSTHPDRSPYMIEVRYQEQKHKLDKIRPNLMEVWAKEVMKQRGHCSAARTVLSREDTRLERASAMIGDFIKAIALQGVSQSPARIRWHSAKCLQLKHTAWPEDPALNFVVLYMRLLQSVRYLPGAHDPDRTNTVVDRIVLNFWPNKALKPELLGHALDQMEDVPGRWTKFLKRDETTGMMQVQMFVDISDCVVAKNGATEESLPLYDRREQPPGYMPS